MDDSIKEQLAERMLPEAALWTLLRSSERQGREDLAQFYLGELMTVMMQKRQVAEQTAAPGPPPMGTPPPGGPPMGPLLGGPPMGPPPMEGPPGLPPEVMPEAMMGVPPPMPTPQAGPIVPPGSPRPGAQGGM